MGLWAKETTATLKQDRSTASAGSGILIHVLRCIPLGHDCVPTVAHAVVLPLGGIAFGNGGALAFVPNAHSSVEDPNASLTRFLDRLAFRS